MVSKTTQVMLGDPYRILRFGRVGNAKHANVEDKKLEAVQEDFQSTNDIHNSTLHEVVTTVSFFIS